jgi:NUC130/3NT domain
VGTSSATLLDHSDLSRSYIEDFRGQYFQYENHREIFMAAPTSATDSGILSLRDLIDFVSHVADCYPDITKGFPQELIDILTLHHPVLEPELREKLVGSLVLLKKKDIIDSTTYGSDVVSPRRSADSLQAYYKRSSRFLYPHQAKPYERYFLPKSSVIFGLPILNLRITSSIAPSKQCSTTF